MNLILEENIEWNNVFEIGDVFYVVLKCFEVLDICINGIDNVLFDLKVFFIYKFFFDDFKVVNSIIKDVVIVIFFIEEWIVLSFVEVVVCSVIVFEKSNSGFCLGKSFVVEGFCRFEV